VRSAPVFYVALDAATTAVGGGVDQTHTSLTQCSQGDAPDGHPAGSAGTLDHCSRRLDGVFPVYSRMDSLLVALESIGPCGVAVLISNVIQILLSP
jgi:hypothetical protein